jgi:hypothetical protein
MEIKTLVSELVTKIIAEILLPENSDRIRLEVIDPFIQYIIKQVYPYLIMTCIIFILMFICIISVLVILVGKFDSRTVAANQGVKNL